VGQVGQGQGGLHIGWARMGLGQGCLHMRWDRMGLGQVGLQIRWDRMGLGQGGLPTEPVHLSQSGPTRPLKTPNPNKLVTNPPPHRCPDEVCVCVLLCFIKQILGNHYVRSWGFIVSEPRETHPRSEIADVPTSLCPPLDNLGCPDPHPSP